MRRNTKIRSIAIFLFGMVTASFMFWFHANFSLRSPIIIQSPITRKQTGQNQKRIPTQIKKIQEITPTAVPTPHPTIKAPRKRSYEGVNWKSDVEIAQYIKSKDWDYEIAIRLAKSENAWNRTKSFDCTRIGARNKNGSYDYGIFQVNTIHSSTLAKKGMTMDDMLDCKKNIDFAYEIYKSRGNWSAWSAYTNKSYLAHTVIEI